MNPTGSQGGHPGAGSSLWSQAAGWRNLAMSAGALTAIAIALPLVFPERPASPAAAPAPVQPPPAATQAAAPQIIYVPKFIPVPAPASRPGAPAAAAVRPPAALSGTGPTAGPCPMILPTAPMLTDTALVISFENRDLAQARMKLAGLQLHGEIDPQYADSQSVMVRMPDGKTALPMVVGKSVTVRVGDRVVVQSRYRNPSLACSYVPDLVTADLGPSPPANPPSATPQRASP